MLLLGHKQQGTKIQDFVTSSDIDRLSNFVNMDKPTVKMP